MITIEDTLRDWIAKVEAERNEARARVAELENYLAAGVAERDRLRELNSRGSLGSLRDDLAASRARVAELEAANTRMWSDYVLKRDRVAELDRQLTLASEVIRLLAEREAALEARETRP